MSDDEVSISVRRRRRRKSVGIARTREPVKEKATGVWRAMYVDPDGTARQAGRFRTKGDARPASQRVVDELNRGGDDPGSTPSLLDFMDDWTRRFPRHPRTEETNRERLERYILPYLPKRGHEPVGHMRRRHLLGVQDELLRRGLSKTTIDGAFSALSALFRDAVELEYLEANPAQRLRVRPNDPRLDPVKDVPGRRAVPPEEIHAFMKHVRPGYRAVCWTPVLTSARPAELFAMRRQDIDRGRQMIFVAETLTRYGKQMEGLKQTHHIAAREQRGRWLLFPAILYEMLGERPPHVSGLLFPSPRGRPWNVRNFYRNIWEPARKEAGVSFTLYDLRHTFCSRLLAAGIPLVEVAAWMGHSLRAGGAEVDNTTSRVYAHATGEWREVALAELTTLVTGKGRKRRSALGAEQA
jgi:integrase